MFPRSLALRLALPQNLFAISLDPLRDSVVAILTHFGHIPLSMLSRSFVMRLALSQTLFVTVAQSFFDCDIAAFKKISLRKPAQSLLCDW